MTLLLAKKQEKVFFLGRKTYIYFVRAYFCTDWQQKSITHQCFLHNKIWQSVRAEVAVQLERLFEKENQRVKKAGRWYKSEVKMCLCQQRRLSSVYWKSCQLPYCPLRFHKNQIITTNISKKNFVKKVKVHALMTSVSRSIGMLDIYVKTLVFEVAQFFRWWTETPANTIADFEVRQS